MEQGKAQNNYIKNLFQGTAREGNARHEPEEARIFAQWLEILNKTGIPYMVGGAFAMHSYTGIWRDTKDLDIFLRAEDLKTALDAFCEAGFRTEITYTNWLAKVHSEPYLLDLIFGTWNGQLRVDNEWLERTKPAEVAGISIQLIPVEEMMTSKFFVAARDRFDGADVVHLIRYMKGKIDWSHVLMLLGENFEILLWHLILFDFVYPGHSDYLPQDLMDELFSRVRKKWSVPTEPKAFRGTLLDPFTFLVDIKDWGYKDARDLSAIVTDEGEALN